MANDTDRADPPAPQPPEWLHRAVVAEGRRRLRGRRLGAGACVVTALVAAATISAGLGDPEPRDRVAAGREAAPSGAAGREAAPPGAAGWVETSDPALGWRFEHPASWSLQRFSGRCRIGAAGSAVTNLDRPLRFESLPGGCTTAWDLSDVPAGFVGVQISHSGGPFMRTGPDTAFPLDASAAQLQEPLGGDGPRFRIIPVSLGGNGRYSVVVWEGRAASAPDRERIERIVSSIRPGAPRTDPLARPAISLGHVPERFGIEESMEYVRATLGDRLLVVRWSGPGPGERRRFEVHRRVGNPLDIAAEVRLRPGAAATEIRGRPGVAVSGGGTASVSWLAADQVTLAVSSEDLPPGEVRRIADALVYRPEDDDLSPPAAALPSDPGDGNRRLTPGVVVLEGIVEGVRWELVAYGSDGGVCADLRFWRGASGGCGFGVGAERPLGVSQGQSSGGPGFVHGVARADVVGVRVELSDGSTIDVPVVSASGFDVRFWATPLPPSLAATGVVARLGDGTEARAR